MAKVPRGRLEGLYGMESQTAEQLHELARGFEFRARVGGIGDDPRWLNRWAKRLHRLAEQKEKARESKAAVRRRKRNDAAE